MLMAHPAVLANLLEQYDALRILHAEQGTADVRYRMDELANSLCVTTGTHDIDAALIAARHQLPGAQVEDDSLLSS